MCGCSRNNNKQPGPPRQIINSPNRNIAPKSVPQNIAPIQPQTRNIVSQPMTPDRKKIERLQREAIRRSLGR